jgi:hypothetical protein
LSLTWKRRDTDIGGSVGTDHAGAAEGRTAGKNFMPRCDPQVYTEFTKFPGNDDLATGQASDVNQEDWNTQLREMATASAAQ